MAAAGADDASRISRRHLLKAGAAGMAAVVGAALSACAEAAPTPARGVTGDVTITPRATEPPLDTPVAAASPPGAPTMPLPPVIATPTEDASPAAPPTPPPTATAFPAAHGRLLARPAQPVEGGPLGLQPLGLAAGRDGLLSVPAGYRPGQPRPLVLMLHGAGGDAASGLAPFQGRADETGLILLAPDSRGRTWDIIVDDAYGRDVAFIDEALAQVFRRYAVDASRVGIAGFSDGASYALSLGMMNGDFFTHAIAFSPGFIAPEDRRGTPRVFIAHGTRDAVLPIDQCSRQIVPQLRRSGYDVRYEEFDGPHTVPPEIADHGLAWFTESQG